MKSEPDEEFFRRPAPPGRSRESSIVLDEAGRFWHASEPIEHRGMVEAFARWLDVHPDDGRYILNNGYDWTYLTVLDTPFVVNGVRHAQAGVPPGQCVERLDLILSDGSREALDPELLWLTPDGELRVNVKQGKFVARWGTDAQVILSECLEECDGSYFLLLAGRRHLVSKRGA